MVYEHDKIASVQHGQPAVPHRDKSKRRSLRGKFLEGNLAVITYSRADSFGNGKHTAQEK